MAAINPISASIRMLVNLGIIDGAAASKSVSIPKINTSVTPNTLDSVVTALAPLLEFTVLETKLYETGRLES